MQIRLWPHPACPSMAVKGIEAGVERLSSSTLRFRYAVSGRIEDIVLPASAPPVRANNLWRSTCFEAFLAPADVTAYRELNFSPSGQWAAYAFAAHRTGMVQASVAAPPDLQLTKAFDRIEMIATLSLDLGAEPHRLGLSAVIEERGGQRSFWAVNHAGAEPDFHHHASFALELPVPA